LRTTRSGRSITINRGLFKWKVYFYLHDDRFLPSWFSSYISTVGKKQVVSSPGVHIQLFV
jgi:hypothetical protein